MIRQAFAAALLFVLAVAPAAAAMPDVARAMLDAAAATGEADQVAVVAAAAAQVFPEDAEAIHAYADALATAIAEGRLGAAEDVVVVVAPPEEEKKAPDAVDSRAKSVELKPGKAPEWLKLGPWEGKATASGVISSGNSENAAGGIHFEAVREFSYFTHNIRTYFDYGRSNGKKNQQRWGLSYKLDYLLGDRTYGFARFSYDEDEFSGFDYKLFGGLGVGHFLFKDEGFSWKLEGGPGYQYAPIDDDRTIDQHAAVYAASETDWLIRDGFLFEQDLNATWTEQTSTLVSKTALTSSLTDTLSTGLSFLYRYETNPPAGRVNADTTFRVNLTYGF
ncbi:DUF481 domain-containing protein [Amphiplicatus metriothermophilus]|uniref:Putative salt-induced outer membrane protein YdiY n=1 Tax=Amphiplicatus metriothermophilus TaxID=1519374 RepID=A0A239PT66_9PROT|nr:DUF481 domain-containing protein [Amphiplicatus metriothermophilus]MBB5519281.1 putative salt-induced outer membrane protein [Amphiplicatus metriothermophilus]SNT73350.1 Putative salt-induced outer membrane protein YdiY [Amphiplicatus metriothermophilus]